MTNKIEFKVYGDTSITFYPDSHQYRRTGEKTCLVSVTGATGIVDKSRVLMQWATRLNADYLREWVQKNPLTEENLMEAIGKSQEYYNEKKEEAADIGSQVHAFAQNYALHQLKRGELPQITDDMPIGVINGISAFLTWVDENHVEFIDVEKLVYSKQHDYVGLADAVAKVHGLLTMIDYKTSNGIYFEHIMQVSAYREAYNEEFGDLIKYSVILKFNKSNGELETKQIEMGEHIDSFEAFKAALTLKNIVKEYTKY
mgnify:CR=1 FL=1